APAPAQPRSGDVLDQRPMDDRNRGWLRRGDERNHRAPRCRRNLAIERTQMVHLGHQRGSCAGTRASRWQSRRRRRPRAVLRRGAQRGRYLERHHRQPFEGQARHARTAHSGNPSARHPRRTGWRGCTRRARYHAGAAGDALVERVRLALDHGALPRVDARLCEASPHIRQTADRPTTVRRRTGRLGSRVRSRLPSGHASRPAAGPCRIGRGQRSRRCAAAPADPAGETVDLKLGVRIASATVEAFGGIGYLEDSGIPLLLRDAQVFPIWEGASNVQALDFLRALDKLGIDALVDAADAWTETADGVVSDRDAEAIHAAIRHADTWLRDHARDANALQAGALRLGNACARATAAALLARHAAWAQRHQKDSAPAVSLRRFCAYGLDRIIED